MASGRSRPKRGAGCQRHMVKGLSSHGLVSLLENLPVLQGNRLFRLSSVRRPFLERSIAVRNFRQSGTTVLGTAIIVGLRLVPYRYPYLDETSIFGEKPAGLLARLEKSLSWAAADSRASALFLPFILLGIRGRTFFVLVLALVFLPSGLVRVSSGRLIAQCLVLRRFLLLTWRFLASVLLLFS